MQTNIPFVRRRVARVPHDPVSAAHDAQLAAAWADRLGLEFHIRPEDTACLAGETGCYPSPGSAAISDD